MKLKLLLSAACIMALHCVNAQKLAKRSSHSSWSKQSNVYEVNLRQYSPSGSIKEFQKHLPRLKKMGVEILWFMPITPIGVEGRKMTADELGSYYAVKNYQAINPEHGTLDDFKKMVKKAHKMGFKVITDWVANHSALDNHWVKQHPNFYVKDSTGKFISPFDWSDVYKLNYKDRELRDSMIQSMRFWIKEAEIDGFRCDVAEEVPADFWKECIDSLKKIKDVYMLAEGNKAWLHEAGFDQTYAWDMMHTMTDLYAKKISLKKFDSLLNASIASFPKNAYRLYFTANHDENSWNGTEFEKYGDAYKTFAVFTQTIYQSVPLIYSGQEEPNKKRLKFFVKDPIQWGKYANADFYTTLLTLRKSNPALSADAAYKKLSTSNEKSIFSFIREKDGHKVAVIINFSDKEQKCTINDKKITGNPYNVFLYTNENVDTKHQFVIEPWGFIIYDYK
ncbi:MAG: hypothetical protein FGM46_03450 [Ferruginibacter sp.]|nr:hypothetical protein [Ferruginibacter sp.]